MVAGGGGYVRPASAAGTRGRVRPESAGRVRPQSAGMNPDRVQAAMGEGERVEYTGSLPLQAPDYGGGRGGSFAGPVDLVRNVRNRPTSARSHCSELSERGANSESSKAFKGLYEAKTESAWLETKFQRSGNASPAEGEMTVVIEYCYNSGDQQVSTKHKEQRYHEEAELVKQYVLHYSPEARIYIVKADYRDRETRLFHRGGEARLGAFEIDARIRVDGELLTVNLWSKLNSKMWPVWPDWQDNLRQLLPVFDLLVRPCALLDDGSVKYITGVHVTLLNYDETKQVAHGPVGSNGLPARLMRGTYTVIVPESDKYFAETAKLELARVPAPAAEGAVELKVPMFAKPRLTARVVLTGGDALGGMLKHCDAKPEDVLITAKDQKTGELLYQQPYRAGEPLHIDLGAFKERIGLPKHRPGGLAAMLGGGGGGGSRAPSARLGLTPSAASLGAGLSEADTDAAAAAAADADADDADDAADAADDGLGEGWLVSVEASLPNYPSAPLDPLGGAQLVRVLKGGAAEVPLTLRREGRAVRVVVATPEAHTDRWCRGLPLPPIPLTVRHRASGTVVCDTVAEVRPGGAPGAVLAAEALVPELLVKELYDILAKPTSVTREAAVTVTVPAGEGEMRVELMPERATGDVRVHWAIASVAARGAQHWSDGLGLPEGFAYNVYHRDTEALVASATFTPAHHQQHSEAAAGGGGGGGGGGGARPGAHAAVTLEGEGALFVGEAYLLEVPALGEVEPAQAVFTVSGGGPTVLHVPLRRACCSLQLRARSELANSGHWAASLPLPPGIPFTVEHAALRQQVAEGVTDAQGNAMLAGHDALFVHQRYVVRVAASERVHEAAFDFVATEGITAVDVTLRRQSLSARVQLRSAYEGTEHWASGLDLPTGIALRVKHKRLGALVLSCAADADGGATLGGQAGLFVGETYTLEAPAAPQLKAAHVDFTVTGRAEQLVRLVFERATADVTLAMRIQQPAGSAHAYAALLAAPSGVRYVVTHRRSGREVCSGYTDQVAKAVLRRPGTLFVGEEYEASAQGGNGIKAASRAFVVAPHHSEVALLVERARASLAFEMVSALSGSSHWAASLPLPADIAYEVRHTASGSLIFSGAANAAPPVGDDVAAAFRQFDRDRSSAMSVREVKAALGQLGMAADGAHVDEVVRRYDASADGELQLHEFAALVAALRGFAAAGGKDAGAFAVGAATSVVRGAVDGDKAGLYVGESYTLVVPPTELFDESAAEFVVAEEHQTTCLLQLRRACADLTVTARSAHADTGHWSAPLPPPSGVPFRIVHARLGLVVAGGTTDDRHALVHAAGGAVLVGEQYALQVDATDAYRLGGGAGGAGGAPFLVAARAAAVELRLARQAGSVELALRSAKSGTAHWSAPLPIPDGIAFNVYHKQLACVVANGATNARGAAALDAPDALFVGEAYVLEVPASAHVRATSREFVVGAAAQQLPVLVERASGQVMVHIGSSEASLPSLPGLQLSLRHRDLGVLVAPPLALGGDRAELLGDDALLVGQAYVLEVSPHPAIMPCSAEFTVLAEPARVELMLERAPASVTLVFRAASGEGRPEPIALGGGGGGGGAAAAAAHDAAHDEPPSSPTRTSARRSGSGHFGKAGSSARLGSSGRLSSASAKDLAVHVNKGGAATPGFGGGGGGGGGGAVPGWAAGLSMPAGIRYEVRHKQTDQLVASGATRVAEEAPSVALPSGRLYAEEAYVLHVLPGDHVEASSCEFRARGDGEPQEVTLMVRRVCGAVSLSFVSYEFGSNHWAASLQLPADARFEVRHKGSGALAFAGSAGPNNRVALPSSGVLFVGETFVLQALSSRLLRGASCEFTARSVPQQVELALERAVGDVSLSLRAADGRPLPSGIPFQVWHQQLQCVVCEGRTSLAASEVPCDPWFVNQGALYVGEAYVLAVPAGHGWKTTALSFTVGDVGLVQLELQREEGRATLHLMNAKSGTGHWSEQLPLPAELLLLVRRAGEDERAGKPFRPAVPPGAVRASVDVAAGGAVLLAHERYVLELQPSERVLRSAAELQLGSSSAPASVELRVPRAWKPALVAVLTTADGIALPAGLHVRAVHLGLGATVAEATTAVADIEVRVTLQAAEAFFLGEEYELRVAAGHGVAEAAKAFSVVGALVGKAADVVVPLGRATGELTVRLFPARLGSEHWAARLALPPQQLEVLQTGQLIASTAVRWEAGQPEHAAVLSQLASLYVGQQYTVRVVQSESVLPVTLPVAIEHYAQDLPLPLSRVWKRCRVTLRSRQELPIPFGVKVQVRHKALGVVVASATTGEEEAQEYERQVESAQLAQRAAASTAQAEQALARLAGFMADKQIYFAGAGDDEALAPEAAWAVDHPRPAYQAQNAKTLDGVAAILAEFDSVLLEVHGETGPADHAPERLAAHFGLHRTKDVQAIMDRLAKQRATACVGALVERGVAQERLYVTYRGRAGGVRTDFIPRSVKDSAARAAGASARLAAAAAELAGVRFHAAGELGLPHAAQVWELDHLDAGARAANHAALRAVAGVMRDHPELRLEVHYETGARLELPAAAEGEALRVPDALCARFNLHALEADAMADRLAQLRVEALMRALLALGLPEPQVLGTFDGSGAATEAKATFSARTTAWRDAQQAAAARAGAAPPAGTEAAAHDLRPAQERLRGLLAAGSLQWNTPAEAADAVAQAWDVAHLRPDANAANMQLLDGLAALLWEFPHALLVVHLETPGAAAAPPALAAHLGLHPKRDARFVFDELAKRRGAAVVGALAQRGVPAARLSATAKGGGGALHAEFDLVPLPAGPPALQRRAPSMLLEGQKLARITRASSVFLGSGPRGAQYASVHKPSSTSAWISTPDALFVGETYVLETVAQPTLGVPHARHEFTVRGHDEEVELYLERPTGDINLQLVYRKASTPHWSAPLALPAAATIRVRHATVGVVMPETPLEAGAEGTALRQADTTAVGLAVMRYSLRSQLFVGETYTLEVLESAELHPTTVEFTVDEPAGPQTVQVLVDRKWRDVTVRLRHARGAAGEEHELPAGIAVRARHDVVGAEVTSGVTPSGGVSATCHLNGAEALYVGQRYTLLVEAGSGLTVISDAAVVVKPGREEDIIDLVVDRACGEVEVRLANALAGSGHWAETLPLPERVPFVVKDKLGGANLVKVRMSTARSTAHAQPEARPAPTVDLSTGVADWQLVPVVTEKALPAPTVDLSTGVANWVLTATHGKFKAGKAPTCAGHSAWFKAQAPAKWLGSAGGDWPPGDTTFELRFEVQDATAAHLELPYTADNSLKAATLNGRPLDIGKSQGFKAFGGLSVIKARGAAQFVAGLNVLQVTVHNGGTTNNPMGFYAKGAATVGPPGTRKEEAKAYGKYALGKAPTTAGHSAWFKAQAPAKWLGSAGGDWPPGDTAFELRFEVQDATAAHLELPYAADNGLKAATLNGHPLDIGRSQGFKTFGGASVIRAEGAAQFINGVNVLLVVVSNGGSTANPMGFYAKGVATVGHTSAAAEAVVQGALIRRESQLYVQRTYVLELEDSALDMLLPATLEFTVVDGRSIVTLPVQRAVGPVTALLRTVRAGTRHWSEPLPLPEVFSFRVLHKALGAVVHEGEVAQPTNARTNTESVELPMPRNLFVGETYTLEAGYQGHEEAARARLAVGKFMEGKMVHFNGAGDRQLPRIEQAWSVHILHEPAKLAANEEVLDGIVAIAAQYPAVHFRVHGETGTADEAPEALAAHYGLHRTRDVQKLMDHLAENRSKACVAALVERGVAPERLYHSFKARTGQLKVDFVPEVPPDPSSGLLRTTADFLVRKQLTTPELRLQRATSDVAVAFRGLHPDLAHWSNHLQMPAGLRVALRHKHLGVEVASGVVADGACFFAGVDEIYCREEYVLSLERGPYTDAAEAVVAPPPGHHEAVLRVGWQARLVRFALVAVDKQASQAAKAAEALARVRAFMEDHDVFFNGAGEPNLPSVEQAWSIDNLDAEKRAANWVTIRGIAAILREYPELHCEVHGETGAADTAPRPLADFLGMHYLRDVQPIMDRLAESRAAACLAALEKSGVPHGQLFVTYKGRGGNIKVDFIPRGTDGGAGAGAGGGGTAEADLRMPLPAGIPFQVRHSLSDQVIVKGRTELSALEVVCPLPPSAALFVAHDYVLEALAGPGTEPNQALFHMAADLTEEDTLEVKLPVKRCNIGEVTLKFESAAPPEARAWAERLALPPNVPYEVLDGRGGLAATGVVPDPVNGAPLNTYELRFGDAYAVRAPETAMLGGGRAEEAVTLEQQSKTVVIALARKTNDVALAVRTDKADTEHWASALALPALFDVIVRHKRLNVVVQEFRVQGHGANAYRTQLERAQLLVGETYTVRVGCSGKAQAELAMRQVTDFMEGKVDGKVKTVHFNGAGDNKLPAIEQSWSIDFLFDDEKRAMNHAVIDGVAEILNRYPAVRMQVHGETGNADVAPAELARHYGLRAKEDVQRICDHLAENRARACMDALVARGVAAERLYVTFKSRTGHLKTDFVPHPAETSGSAADEAMGVLAAVGEFTVQPQSVSPPQEVALVLARTTGSLAVRLKNPHAGSDHWSGCLPLANGVPLYVRHVGLGHDFDLLAQEVYDGEVLLGGADTLFVGERYLVYAPDTIRSTAASAEVVVSAGTQVLQLAMMRPARRIELQLLTQRASAEQLRRAEAARARVLAFMEDNDVFFNGAAERATKESALGTAQAWAIDHLDAAKRAQNWKTIEGIAAILKEYPDISCEVYGQTGGAEAAPAPLAEYHHLDRKRDVREIMERLAQSRAEACLNALVHAGVPAARLFETHKGMTGELKVDFIPRAQRTHHDTVLPAGIPFRLLHQRTSTGDAAALREALARVRAFMEDHDVFFNGAGEEGLPATEQAWAIDHLEPAKREQNWRTIEGIASIMNHYPHLCLEVHGETGAAKAAPRRLAEHLRLDRVADVQEAMDRLAEFRAQACLGALMHKGVAGDRLFLSYKGRGGNIKVDFIPRSVNPYGAPPGHECCRAPLALVHEGHTATHGQEVVCPLPDGAALYIDETYVLQVPHRPDVLSLDVGGSVGVGELCLESALVPFRVEAEAAGEQGQLVRAELQLRPIETSGLGLLCRTAHEGTAHWAAPLHLPRGTAYEVHALGALAGQRPVQSGALEPSGPGQSAAQLPPTGMVPGRAYEMRVPYTAAVLGAAATFEARAEPQEVRLTVERVTADVRVRWGWAQGAWYEHLELPSAVPFTLTHHELQVEALAGVLRRGTQQAPSEAEQLAAARERVRAFVEENDVFFNGASDPSLQPPRGPGAAQAWALDHLDAATRAANWQTVEGIAAIMNHFPSLGLQVHGQAASQPGEASPELLAAHYGLHARDDHATLMQALARNRAEACAKALVSRGVDAARLVVSSEAMTSASKTDFVPLLDADLRTKRRAERAGARKRREADALRARQQVMRFMEDNDVLFNGARERATKESAKGIVQAWAIDHLDAAKQAQNWKTIEGIAEIMNRYPEIACEVRGETTKAKAAEPLLAQHEGLDKDRDVGEIMDRLGKHRAEACRDALIQRGVDPNRLFVSFQGRAGQMKVDFIPSASKGAAAEDDYEDVPLRPAAPPTALGEPLGTLEGLLVQESFELRVGAPTAYGWAPVSAAQLVPCSFEVHASAVPVAQTTAAPTVDLSTGVANWVLTRDHGRFRAGRAPTTAGHSAWFKAQAPAMWLGSAGGDWPPGDTTFELRFEVQDATAAHLELPYAADNSLKAAALNGHPLDIGKSQGFKTFGGASVIRAEGAAQFINGVNVLQVTVHNGGTTNNPMGFYAKGAATVGRAQMGRPTYAQQGPPQEVRLELTPAHGNVGVSIVSELERTDHWAAALPLPEEVRYEVRHKGLNVRVLGLQGETLTPPRSVLPSEGTLLAGETYTLTVTDPAVAPAAVDFTVRGGSEWTDVALRLRPRECAAFTLLFDIVHGRLPRGVYYRVSSVARAPPADAAELERARAALKRVKAFMEDNDVFFNGVFDKNLPTIAQSWSISHTDPAKAALNARTLDGIAAILAEYPSLGLQVHGQTGPSKKAPEELARFYGMREREDLKPLYDHLARNRAAACKDAFVARGIDPQRLHVSFKSLASEPKTDFIPRPMAELAAEAARAAPEADAGAAALPDRVIVEGPTDREGAEVAIAFAAADAGRLLLGHRYVLEVFSGGPGGVAPHTQTFRVEEPRAEVRARLHLQGDVRLQWLGPQLAAPQSDGVGDGDDADEPAAAPVVGVIPFRISSRRTGALVLSGEKAEPDAPTDVQGNGLLLQGEEYVIATEHTAATRTAPTGWAPHSLAFTLGSALDTISLHMTPSSSAPPPPPPPASGVPVALVVRGAPAWAAALPLPSPLGFAVTRDADGAVVAQGAVGAAGGGALRAGVLTPGAAYTLQLATDELLAARPMDDAALRAAFAAADADGSGEITPAELATHRQRQQEQLRNAARFEAGAALRFVAAAGAGAPQRLELQLARRTRDVRVRVLAEGGAPPPGALPLRACHVAAASHTACGAQTDAAGGATLPGAAALFVGERYTLHVGGSATTAAAAVEFVPEAGAAYAGAQELAPVSVAAFGAAWYDERPPPADAPRVAGENAAQLRAALKGLRTDNRAIMAALAGKSLAELQLLREAYRRDQRADLGEDLKRRGSALKGKAAKLEQLMVRDRAELDAIMVRFGVQAAAQSGREVEPVGELLEVLCTSLPHSLVAMREKYRSLYSKDPADAIRESFGAASSTSIADSAVPLLVGLLENAGGAAAASTAAAVPADAEQLRAALADASDDGAVRLCALFAARSRRHVRQVAAAVGGDVGAQLRRRFSGALHRALALLLEPSEEHYARKLHAAFHGIKRTPDFEAKTLEAHPKKKGSFLERRQSASGLMTHDDTLVTVVASRLGRDLSGIKHAYQQLYRKALVDELNSETHGDLKTLLVGIVQQTVPYTGEYS